MARHLLGGFVFVLILLASVAAYFFHAPKPPLPGGAIELATLDIGGHPRRYAVFTPARLRAGASVLVAFHPSRSSGDKMRGIVGSVLERIAEAENVVVVYPDGYEGYFNDCRRAAPYSARQLNVDDVGFTRRIIERLVAEKRIDVGSVYAIGYSNGGHMALRLALEAPEMVKGVAAIAANLPASSNMDCTIRSSPPRVIVLVEGTRDRINPYDGGPVTLFGLRSRGDVLSAHATAEWFARALRLTAKESPAGEPRSGIAASQQDWSSPTGHVRLITIEGGGHTVPQSTYLFPRIYGATLQSDSVLESMWRLFAERAAAQSAAEDGASPAGSAAVELQGWTSA